MIDMVWNFPWKAGSFSIKKYAILFRHLLKYIGKDINQTKYIVKKAFSGKLPEYLFNKPKTGWSAPITAWINDSEILQKKFNETINNKDAIKDMLSLENVNDPNYKRRIVYWLFRTWSQKYNMIG